MESQSTSRLSPLLASVEPYDSWHLLTRVAALQLVPLNASRLIRLGLLAATVASRPRTPGRHTISARGLRRLKHGQALAQIAAHQEDRVLAPFSESVFLYGGDYVVLPGLQEHAVYIVKAFAAGMFRREGTSSDERFART